MKLFSSLAGVLSVCMCFLKLQSTELPEQPYKSLTGCVVVLIYKRNSLHKYQLQDWQTVALFCNQLWLPARSVSDNSAGESSASNKEFGCGSSCSALPKSTSEVFGKLAIVRWTEALTLACMAENDSQHVGHTSLHFCFTQLKLNL